MMSPISRRYEFLGVDFLNVVSYSEMLCYIVRNILIAKPRQHLVNTFIQIALIFALLVDLLPESYHSFTSAFVREL